MSANGPAEARLLGGIDYADLSDLGLVSVLTLKTNEISANTTAQFNASEDDDLVDTIQLTPEDATLPNRARIVHVKANVVSGSTDSDLRVIQSETFNAIEQVVDISGLTINDNPNSYILGGGLGMPFVNKEEESEAYFEIVENSNNASVYEIEMSWYSIG